LNEMYQNPYIYDVSMILQNDKTDCEKESGIVEFCSNAEDKCSEFAPYIFMTNSIF